MSISAGSRTLRTVRNVSWDGGSQDAPRPDRLSDRELQVLRLVAEGWSNRVIADYLAITERTVKNHLTNIMGKLHAHDRTHAVVTAVRLGWMEI